MSNNQAPNSNKRSRHPPPRHLHSSYTPHIASLSIQPDSYHHHHQQQHISSMNDMDTSTSTSTSTDTSMKTSSSSLLCQGVTLDIMIQELSTLTQQQHSTLLMDTLRNMQQQQLAPTSTSTSTSTSTPQSTSLSTSPPASSSSSLASAAWSALHSSVLSLTRWQRLPPHLIAMIWSMIDDVVNDEMLQRRIISRHWYAALCTRAAWHGISYHLDLYNPHIKAMIGPGRPYQLDRNPITNTSMISADQAIFWLRSLATSCHGHLTSLQLSNTIITEPVCHVLTQGFSQELMSLIFEDCMFQTVEPDPVSEPDHELALVHNADADADTGVGASAGAGAGGGVAEASSSSTTSSYPFRLDAIRDPLLCLFLTHWPRLHCLSFGSDTILSQTLHNRHQRAHPHMTQNVPHQLNLTLKHQHQHQHQDNMQTERSHDIHATTTSTSSIRSSSSSNISSSPLSSSWSLPSVSLSPSVCPFPVLSFLSFPCSLSPHHVTSLLSPWSVPSLSRLSLDIRGDEYIATPHFHGLSRLSQLERLDLTINGEPHNNTDHPRPPPCVTDVLRSLSPHIHIRQLWVCVFITPLSRLLGVITHHPGLCASLEELKLFQGDLGDAVLEPVSRDSLDAQFSHLDSLSLVKLQQLRTLWLGPDITDEDITHMQCDHINTLHTLHVECVTGSFISSWRPCVFSLTCLTFNDSELTDSNLAELIQKCPHLSALNLTICGNITDTSIQHIITRPIRQLHIIYAKLSDAGIAALCAPSPSNRCQPVLELLDIRYCHPITGTMLMCITQLPHLRAVAMGGRQYISHEEKEENASRGLQWDERNRQTIAMYTNWPHMRNVVMHLEDFPFSEFSLPLVTCDFNRLKCPEQPEWRNTWKTSN